MNKWRNDFLAVGLLCLLWGVFFWRLFTPIAADQVSFRQGDFSGQFVAFGAYQYHRMAQGEIPLWNPYNNGGLPFIADTQAAVFYPPRWLTVALSQIAGGWSYHALELEAVFHMLLYSLLMYVFVRRLTLAMVGSIYGAFVAAIIAAYGGFMAGYPPLQLALLEAAVWLPLAALGILEATRSEKLGWGCLALAGLGLGLSWLAGHPQTSWFLTYVLLAWFAYRAYGQRLGWRQFLVGILFFGLITVGVTAITFIPSAEYLLLTARADLGFDAKGNGFPFQDVLQFIFPATVSLFSPLYVGIPALLLAYLAIRQRVISAWFWGVVALVGLLHSFGANTAFYSSLYNFLPGLRFFRGQERAAVLVANSLAIVAGLGMAYLVNWRAEQEYSRWRRFVVGMLVLIVGLTALLTIAWLGFPDEYGRVIGAAFLSSGVMVAAYLLSEAILRRYFPQIALLLFILVTVFELFSVNMHAESNYESRIPTDQLSLTPPPLIETVLADKATPFRVDGFRGVQANYGSLYGVMDIRGISPLFLTSMQRLVYLNYVDNPLAWELLAVKYVYSANDTLSSPSSVIAEGTDRDGAVKLHQLADPRPYALLLYQADSVDSDEFAWALLNDPRYRPRESVIIQGAIPLELPAKAPAKSSVIVTSYQPEKVVLTVNTPANAILSLAQVDYRGWYATVDGEPTPILRAYGALMAVAMPAGEHTVTLVYDPLSYRVGAILSLVTWGGLAILAVFRLVRRRSNPA